MINQHGGSSSLRENRCHIWPVKKDDTQSNDIAFFEKAFREQSSRWGLYEIVLGCPGEGNISLYQSVNQGADVPHILIAAGFHGEEPAGCWGMLDFLREGSPELFDNVAVSFLPLVNLSGLSAGCRLNSTGQNPNRGFTNGAEVEPSVEGKVLLNYEALLKNAARHGVLCCHEDILRQQAYLYTFEHTARPGHFSVALKLYQLSGDSWGQSTIIRCNESGEVPAASWDHNITVQENIRSPKSDIRILELQTLSSQYKIAVLC